MTDDYASPPTARQPGGASDPPIARRKLSHEVLDRLLPRIRSGEFAVGSRLPSERELMQALGVGRPAVREALQTLERMGLVSIVHGEGARVLPLSAEKVIAQISDSAMHLFSGSSDLLEHLKEARLQFEIGMARMAAERATPQQVEQLGLLLDAHKASVDDPERFLRTDMAFHRGIAAISGNPIYAAVSQAMLEWLEQFHHDLVRAPGAEKTTLAEHVKLFKCIASHDPDGAAAALTAHLKRANRHYGPRPAPTAGTRRRST
ncbi:transcriptional regulator NanR [Arenimonas sp.]|uniref:transcriptional regulator NanR n=1 Tax=Arenimonas sp. TaxID=1872635 RepID=UPI002E32FE3B|nr:transcriptional regulator NanR [Arenimonas sp.]HEX4853698.1 transcriptional regulator NanR [Arenimonas sp.]